MKGNSSGTWVGWQGVVAEVPADWNLAAVSGDEKSGYFRVDGSGSLMLEAKWSSAGRQVDLYSKLDAYLSDMRRRARKRRASFEHKIKSKGAGVLTFSWRSDRKGQGRLWRCDECGRVIIAQVSGGPSEDVQNLASQILPTIQDHSEDGWRTWAMYDLIADVPPGYVLEKHRLMSGYIQLVFRKRTSRLVIERWGLANVALKHSSLHEWFDDRAAYDLKAYRYSLQDVEFEEESGIQITGRRAGLRQALKSAYELVTLRRPAVYLDGYVWLCQESNKIYAVQSLHRRNENIVDQVLERVGCH
ncbi:MAG TPA: hypothetical protein VMX94_04835 [Armatimonadota bacterium]|nr:hypothetical protein [Armatimonadota bacterium]